LTNFLFYLLNMFQAYDLVDRPSTPTGNPIQRQFFRTDSPIPFMKYSGRFTEADVFAGSIPQDMGNLPYHPNAYFEPWYWRNPEHYGEVFHPETGTIDYKTPRERAANFASSVAQNTLGGLMAIDVVNRVLPVKIPDPIREAYKKYFVKDPIRAAHSNYRPTSGATADEKMYRNEDTGKAPTKEVVQQSVPETKTGVQNDFTPIPYVNPIGDFTPR
jgi:hypothetical protein